MKPTNNIDYIYNQTKKERCRAERDRRREREREESGETDTYRGIRGHTHTKRTDARGKLFEIIEEVFQWWHCPFVVH